MKNGGTYPNPVNHDDFDWLKKASLILAAIVLGTMTTLFIGYLFITLALKGTETIQNTAKQARTSREKVTETVKEVKGELTKQDKREIEAGIRTRFEQHPDAVYVKLDRVFTYNLDDMSGLIEYSDYYKTVFPPTEEEKKALEEFNSKIEGHISSEDVEKIKEEIKKKQLDKENQIKQQHEAKKVAFSQIIMSENGKPIKVSFEEFVSVKKQGRWILLP